MRDGEWGGGDRSPLKWGPPCASPSEAKRLGRAEVDAGNATLAFVVVCDGDRKYPLSGNVYPASARRIIGHWLALLAATGG